MLTRCLITLLSVFCCVTAWSTEIMWRTPMIRPGAIIQLPVGTVVLAVERSPRLDHRTCPPEHVVVIYYRLKLDASTEQRTFVFVDTGDQLSKDMVHVGTVQVSQDGDSVRVAHIFELITTR